MKEYAYFWYHHMMSKNERQRIEAALNNKDYFAFIDLYKKYSIKAIELGKYDEELKAWIPMIFLPSEIMVTENEDYNNSTYISILDKENFEKINFYECECG